MVKKLTRVGNSLGVVIDRPILDLLKITDETPLEITTDGDGLHIRPLRTVDPEQALAAGRRIMRDHAPTLKKLAK